MKIVCDCGKEIELGKGTLEIIQPKRLVTDRIVFFIDWYKRLGFELNLPVPDISEEEYMDRKVKNQELFYRLSVKEMEYDDLMIAVGQKNHFTLTEEDVREKIAWEMNEKGYWFWADVQTECPRLNQTWNGLEKSIKMLSLEEYIIVWHSRKATTGQMLDVRTWTWLRTRYGQGALFAFECGGEVCVRSYDASYLSVSYGYVGGRAAEVV